MARASHRLLHFWSDCSVWVGFCSPGVFSGFGRFIIFPRRLTGKFPAFFLVWFSTIGLLDSDLIGFHFFYIEIDDLT